MIQMQTQLDVADNSGVKKVMCIKVLGGSKRQFAHVGDVIVCSVKKALPSSEIKPGSVIRGVIVRTKKTIRRKDGSYVRFDRNALVVVDKDGNPIEPEMGPSQWGPALSPTFANDKGT